MRRGRHEGDTGESGREALALLLSLNRSFACSVRRLSGRVPAPMIDLVAKI
jgi:hypothetical protein